MTRPDRTANAPGMLTPLAYLKAEGSRRKAESDGPNPIPPSAFSLQPSEMEP